MYTNLPTSQGYIFRILQHFATKLCSFSNFDNFLSEISFVIPRLRIFLKRKTFIGYQNYNFTIDNLTLIAYFISSSYYIYFVIVAAVDFYLYLLIYL